MVGLRESTGVIAPDMKGLGGVVDVVMLESELYRMVGLVSWPLRMDGLEIKRGEGCVVDGGGADGAVDERLLSCAVLGGTIAEVPIPLGADLAARRLW